MTKEPWGAGDVGDAGNPDDPDDPRAVTRLREASATSATSEVGKPSDEATISTLDAARARRDGPLEVEPPLAQPIPLRAPTPRKSATPRHAVESTAAVPEPQPPDAEPPPEPPPDHVPRSRATTPPVRAIDSVSASREVIAALSGDDNPPAGKRPSPEPAAVDAPRADRGQRSRVAAPEVGRSLNVEFPPKLGARRIIGVLLLVSLAATAATAYLAYADPRPLTLGGAGTLLVVTLVLYAVRAGSSPTLIAIRSGQLEVTRGKSVERFDLTSRFTRIEVVGKPGRPGWKVLLGRFGRDPLVLTSSVVDSKALTAELARYHPRP